MKRFLLKQIIISVVGLTTAIPSSAQVYEPSDVDANRFLKPSVASVIDRWGNNNNNNNNEALGLHWLGHQVDERNTMSDVYLVNVKTGEYLNVGDYRGATCIADYIGMPLNIVPGKTNKLGDSNGFWIADMNHPGHSLGRGTWNEGGPGGAEATGYLYPRNINSNGEYQTGKNQGGTPGGFVWHFHPVKADADEGYHYIIYSHRQTNHSLTSSDNEIQSIIEYRNRDSYYCLSLKNKDDKAYNVVRFKKFAGKMCYLEDEDGADKNGLEGAMADEIPFVQEGKNEVSLEEGLAKIASDERNLWKIVTREERERYRLTASTQKPVNVSFFIKNNKFYNNYLYNQNKAGNVPLDFEWSWYDDEDATNPATVHIHPFDKLTTEADYYTENDGLHKIGVGHYWKYGLGIPEEDAQASGDFGGRKIETLMTVGHDANLVGSIYKGSARLQQEITGLREGNYLVFCRAFYVPDVTKLRDTTFTQQDVNNLATNISSYLFAKTYDNETNTAFGKVVKRQLPSVYAGLVDESHFPKLSKEAYLTSQDFYQTTFGYGCLTNFENGVFRGVKHSVRIQALKDEFMFTSVDGSQIGRTSGKRYYLPKNLSGASRMFDVYNSNDVPEAFNYRIGIPCEVGADGKLCIGVNHTAIAGQPEWVCFDDFELYYIGKSRNEVFVIDEMDGTYRSTVHKKDGLTGNTIEVLENQITKNGSRRSDIFTQEQVDNAFNNTSVPQKAKVTVALRRKLTRKGYTGIFLPIDLNSEQIDAMFGKGTKVVKLANPAIVGRTLCFEPVTEIKAGLPYLIKPAATPTVSAADTYKRQPFTLATSNDKIGWFSNDEARNLQMDSVLNGPIYTLENFEVDLRYYFPSRNNQEQWRQGWRDNINPGATEHTTPTTEYQISGREHLGKFKVKWGYQYEPDRLDENKNRTIPANSYIFVDGQIRRLTKEYKPKYGLYSFIQVYHATTGENYAKSIFDGDDEFYVVDGETTGIEDINQPASEEVHNFYDLQGRRVSAPTKGLYISNKQKILFK